MILIRRLVLVASAVFFFSTGHAFAANINGYVQVSKNQKVYAEYTPAAAGRPTLVLLNGLTYKLENWDDYVSALKKRDPGIGILRFDMIGMGRTLLNGELPVNYQIPHTDQVKVTQKLFKHFGIRKAFVVGLSYGGAIAVAFGTTHPELVEQLILMAPFTESMKAMDQWIKGQVAATRFTFPFNPASDDELYDYFLRNFIYSSYPSLEPSVIENPYKLEGVFRMIQGVRHYNTLKDAGKLPAGSTHLLVAAEDQYIEREVLDRFWSSVPERARASRINITRSQHKIPETIPEYAAAWTLEIISRRPELNKGLVFEGSTRDFNAKSGSHKIQLKK